MSQALGATVIKAPGRGLNVADCLFCAIAAGNIPSASLYEDARVVAFLDIRPLAEGHALVVPKRHAGKLEDASPDDRQAMMEAVAKLTPVLCKQTGTRDATIAINNGPDAGQEVQHVHVHIVPRSASDGAGPIHNLFQSRPKASSEALHDLAVRVQTTLGAP
jgi:histidine triad (HIT) family protein